MYVEGYYSAPSTVPRCRSRNLDLHNYILYILRLVPGGNSIDLEFDQSKINEFTMSDGIESKLDLDKVWNKDRWVDV